MFMEEHNAMFTQMKKAREEQGFTLIELLITIVVVGILAAVVVLSIDGLTNTGATSACKTSKDAAEAASQVYYANHSSTWPTSFTVMNGNELNPSSDVTVAADTITHGSDWTLTATWSATAAPTFVCS
jgi:prepilin-type N-terminal cleavage/methylation domain-containing protein